LKVDPKDRLSATELLEHDLIKGRETLTKEMTESISLNNSSFTRKVLLEKIMPPRKKDFRNIRDKLPKNRFENSSVDKISENKSCYEEKSKENLYNFVNSNRITRKDVLPSIKRTTSLKSQK
jgi:serine/threonine protein kinase